MSNGNRAALLLALAYSCLVVFQDTSPVAAKPDATGATVRGRVTFRGTVPPVEQIPVMRDTEFCGKMAPNESLTVDRATGGLAGVVVSLEGTSPSEPAPTETRALLDNRACRFSPTLRAVRAGSVLEISNADPVLHNTHIRKGNVAFLNVALPPGGRTIRKPLNDAGRLEIRCDAHRFMRASIHIFDHPYFTVTDEKGQFELPRVPPGTYRLLVWQDTFGMTEQSVTVPGGTSVSVNLELKREK
jgi:plastocyanin